MNIVIWFTKNRGGGGNTGNRIPIAKYKLEPCNQYAQIFLLT